MLFDVCLNQNQCTYKERIEFCALLAYVIQNIGVQCY